jgi:glycosyltransferase involved in cell wall biosynthesis
MPVGISVVCPTHNRRETVVLALRSALAQTRAPEEVIVVCDGCTDGTQEAAAALDPRVVVLDLPKGPGYGYDNRNRALERARGEAVSYLGDDDLWLPDHLERVGALLDRGKGLVQAMTVGFGPDDQVFPLAYDWSVPYFRWLFDGGPGYTPATAVSHRVDVALSIGGWDAGIERSGDEDLWRRLLHATETAMTGAPTVLNFQAIDRKQAWPDRVAQNARWLARLEDPEELTLVREELDRAFREADAWRLGQIAALKTELARVQNVLDGVLASRWWRLRRLLPGRR